MRARSEDTFFKLSNPRKAQVKGTGPKGKGNTRVDALLIDYVVVRRGKLDGGVLVIHTEDGGRAEVMLNSLADRDHGTIELVGVTNVGFFKRPQVNAKTEFPDKRGILRDAAAIPVTFRRQSSWCPTRW